MDVESDPVAGAVEIALHPSIDEAGLVPGFFKSGADTLMNPLSIRPIFDFRDGLFLRIQDRLVEPLQFGARGPTHHGPGHVGEIPVGGRTRKHVEDNTTVSRQRPTAFVVWIAGLLARGDDGMLSDTVALHQCHIDQLLHSLRRQRHPSEPQLIPFDRGLTQHVMGGRDRLLGRALGCFDITYFFGRLHNTLLVERVSLRIQLIPQGLELDGMAEGKIRRDQDLRDAGFSQEDMDDLDRTWLGDTLRLGSSFDLRIREHPIDGRLTLCPIHFEIAHHQNPLPFNLQIDKGVRRNKFRGVIQIGVGLAGSDEDRGTLRFRSR